MATKYYPMPAEDQEELKRSAFRAQSCRALLALFSLHNRCMPVLLPGDVERLRALPESAGTLSLLQNLLVGIAQTHRYFLYKLERGERRRKTPDEYLKGWAHFEEPRGRHVPGETGNPVKSFLGKPRIWDRPISKLADQ